MEWIAVAALAVAVASLFVSLRAARRRPPVAPPPADGAWREALAAEQGARRDAARRLDALERQQDRLAAEVSGLSRPLAPEAPVPPEPAPLAEGDGDPEVLGHLAAQGYEALVVQRTGEGVYAVTARRRGIVAKGVARRGADGAMRFDALPTTRAFP
jgi:hypothetical protein